MRKLILRIKHTFTGHGLLIDYDDKYLYCECGVKYRHYNHPIAKDWIMPYIDNK